MTHPRIALLAMCVATLWAGRVVAEETVYEKFRTFQTILRLVRDNYVDEVEGGELLDGAIDGMLSELDPHSDYIDAERFAKMNERNRGEYHGIGISFAIRGEYLTVIAPIEGSPADRLGLRAGDRIVKIDGNSAVGISESEVVETLRGPKGSTVSVSVARAGHEKFLDFDIVRDKIPIKSVPYAFMLDDGTGYIRMIRFSATTGDELERALDQLEEAGMQRLVFDLRGNAGGYLEQAIEVADKFIDGRKMLVYTKGRISGSSEEHHATQFATHEFFPLIVMIDHGSASASEIVSGAIQDWDRGLVVGQTSFGKGLVQRQYRLNDGSALFLTVARYYTPAGRLIQREYQKGDKLTYYSEGYDDIDPNAADSTAADRPVYTTAAGRQVYGGGGITPDVRLDPTELSSTQQVLEESRVFFEFANAWVGKHGFRAPSFESFREDFEVDQAMWQEFVAEVENRALEVTIAELEVERPAIARGLRREIAGNLWGAKERYQILIEGDRTLAAAVERFDEAEALIALQHAGVRSSN